MSTTQHCVPLRIFLPLLGTQGIRQLANANTIVDTVYLAALLRTALPLVGSGEGGITMEGVAKSMAAAAGVWGLLRVAASEMGKDVSMGLEEVSVFFNFGLTAVAGQSTGTGRSSRRQNESLFTPDHPLSIVCHIRCHPLLALQQALC